MCVRQERILQRVEVNEMYIINGINNMPCRTSMKPLNERPSYANSCKSVHVYGAKDSKFNLLLIPLLLRTIYVTVRMHRRRKRGGGGGGAGLPII